MVIQLTEQTLEAILNSLNYKIVLTIKTVQQHLLHWLLMSSVTYIHNRTAK